MRRRSITWPVLAVLFTLGNVAGAIYAAAAMGEMRHAGVHVALAVLGAWFTWQLVDRRHDATPALQAGSEATRVRGDLANRLTNLEQSIDAVAVEVERVGESQRFMTRLFTERGGEKSKPQ